METEIYHLEKLKEKGYLNQEQLDLVQALRIGNKIMPIRSSLPKGKVFAYREGENQFDRTYWDRFKNLGYNGREAIYKKVEKDLKAKKIKK